MTNDDYSRRLIEACLPRRVTDTRPALRINACAATAQFVLQYNYYLMELRIELYPFICQF